MADYKSYLAASILTEDKIVTYRLLSRALKVHVNEAKQMLYDFHHHQNSKKPGTVHATYLLSGTKRDNALPTNGLKKDGEDDYMQSSPFMGSSIPEAVESTGESGVLTISLVKQEDLDQTSSQYDTIASIHIYSIGPHPLKDLQLLSDTTRELGTLIASEDPLESAPKYGTILNPLVKRRPSRRPPVATAAKPAPQITTPKPTEVAKKEEAPKKQEQKPSQPTAAKEFFGKGKEKSKPAAASGPSSKESTPAPPATLKRESSSIFKSFAKAKPKLKREGTDSSAAEDVSMKGMRLDDDDEEDYAPPAIVKKGSEEPEGDRKSRKEREEKLRKMMDESDEEEVVPTPTPELEEEETILEKEKPAQEDEPSVTVSGGRRRGKRRIMKKKTVKDEEGYLVTKEEAVWESFSEDEPVPAPKANRPASIIAKGKKGAAKAGQGNIMSFFGKK